jgi:arylsulfatase
MTGRYCTRVGVPGVLMADAKTGLSLEEKTIADVLKTVGYHTGCIGKWHLGATADYLPTKRGFDEYYGIPYSNDMAPSVLLQNTAVIETPVQLDTLTYRYTQQAVNFISRAKAAPFFLFMAHTFPHIPLAVSPSFRGKSGLGLYGDVIQEIDWSVGQVMQALTDNGVANNTLVMFLSDNGPWFQGSPGNLRGRKGSSYEGGVRVPLIAHFPGKIPSGRMRGMFPLPRVTNSVATTLDLLPTIAALANAPTSSSPHALDGVNIWPLLSGAVTDVPHELFLYFDNWNLQCARLGPWKLHVARYNSFPWSPDPVAGFYNLPIVPELYNLERDPQESYDAAPEHPDIVADISARIQKALPTFPPDVMAAWVSTQSLKSIGNDGGLPVRVP